MNLRELRRSHSIDSGSGFPDWSIGRLRWLLLMVYIFGYILTAYHFGDYAFGYAFFTLLAVVSSALVFIHLRAGLRVTLPVWVVMAVFFVGYFIKFYWLVLQPEIVETAVLSLSYGHSTPRSQYAAFSLTVMGFVAFCIVSCIYLKAAGGSTRACVVRSHLRRHRSIPWHVAYLPMLIALVVILATTVVMSVANVAVMGMENAVLPFRLAGVVYFARTVLVPALLLTQIVICYMFSSGRGVVLAILVLLVFGVLDMLYRSSRAGFFALAVVLWFFSVFFGRRPRFKDILWLIVAIIVFAFLHHFIAEYRNIRINDGGAIRRVMVATEDNLAIGNIENAGDVVWRGISATVYRITGIDMIIMFKELNVRPLGLDAWQHIVSDNGVAGYLTRDILGHTNASVHSSAPSLLGWFYLVGGDVFVVVGVALFFGLFFWGWYALLLCRIRSMSITLSLVLIFILPIIIDGTLEKVMSLGAASIPCSLFVCEFLLGFLSGRTFDGGCLAGQPQVPFGGRRG